MPPTVSVVIATYNYGCYLSGAIDSALGQTFEDLEVVVVDDGSTDDTPQVIEPYLSDPRVRYHRTENQGQPAAKNTGISLARGRLVAFLDADDLWLPEKLELQVALFEADAGLGVAYTRRLQMDANGRRLEYEQPQLHRGNVLPKMFEDNFVCFSSSMVRHDVFDAVGTFDERIPLAIDYDLWLRVARTFRFDYVDRPLVEYRTGHANLSQRGEERLFVALGIMDRFLAEHGGRDLLPAALIRRAYAETHLHIGQVKRRRNWFSAVPWHMRALGTDPTSLEAWNGFARLFLPEPIRQLASAACGLIRSKPIVETQEGDEVRGPAAI